MRSGLFVKQHLGYPFRGHLVTRPGFVSALDERKLKASAHLRFWAVLLGKAAPQKLCYRVLELPVLLDRADLDSAYQFIRKIQRRLHRAIMPESWFSGPCLQPRPRVLPSRYAALSPCPAVLGASHSWGSLARRGPGHLLRRLLRDPDERLQQSSERAGDRVFRLLLPRRLDSAGSAPVELPADRELSPRLRGRDGSSASRFAGHPPRPQTLSDLNRPQPRPACFRAAGENDVRRSGDQS
ncbi:MAG: hypothetical protein QOH06_1102 [Acidobacteriota bacterium]|nr:hypothetical protein [Acidobacteriota bacterium]